MFHALLSSILPTFGIMFIGWLARRLHIWGKPAVSVLNRYAYYIGLPALIFYALLHIDVSARDLTQDGLLLLGAVLAHGLIFLLWIPFLAMRSFSKPVLATTPMLIAFGSTAYVGIPFATFTFGFEGTVLASLLSVTLVIVMLFLSIFFLNHFARASLMRDPWHSMLELPFLWAVLAGIAWSMFALPTLPLYLDNFIRILADTAGPTALLGFGAFLFDIKIARIAWKPTIFVSVLAVSLPTLLVYIVLSLIGFTGLPLFVAVSMAASPSAVTCFILSQQHKIGQTFVAGVILLSVFFSLASYSVIAVTAHNVLL